MSLPDSEGQRLIIIGFMCEDGIVKNTVKVFVGQKKAKDYHSVINGQHFEDYIREQVINELVPGSVVVMDKASYHSRLWNKDRDAEKSRCRGLASGKR